MVIRVFWGRGGMVVFLVGGRRKLGRVGVFIDKGGSLWEGIYRVFGW